MKPQTNSNQEAGKGYLQANGNLGNRNFQANNDPLNILLINYSYKVHTISQENMTKPNYFAMSMKKSKKHDRIHCQYYVICVPVLNNSVYIDNVCNVAL